MIYGTVPTQYKLLEAKQQLPSTGTCIKHDNEETIQDGTSHGTSKILRMITNSARVPLATRKEKLKEKLSHEQSAWERELEERLGGRDTPTKEEEDISRLKRKLEDLCRTFWTQEKEMSDKLLQKQEDLKRLNLLNANAARDLSKLIETRSAEYKKDCSAANIQMLNDKRNQKQNIMLWETQYLDQVLFSDNQEEKARESRDQMNEFITSNRKLIEAKRRERDETRARDEAYLRSKVEENEREKREEERAREEERLGAIRQSQAQLNYLNYKRKEREDWERQEKEKERDRLLEDGKRLEEEAKVKRHREKEERLEELRLCLAMREKCDAEARHREKLLMEYIEAEWTKRNEAKLKELAEQAATRQCLAQHTRHALKQQIEERERLRAEREREKLVEAEYWRERRTEIQVEEERERQEARVKREEQFEALRQQLEFNQHRKQC